MTDKRSTPTTEAELHTELKTLFRQAYDGGLNVEGGWECRNGDGYPDWDVLVTEVKKDGPS
jgi:hypothetical protein